MGEPANKVFRADTKEGVPNAGPESLSRSKGELAKVVFDEAPARLDGAEIGRIRWQKHELRTLRLNELANQRGAVLTEVVHHDDVAGVETRTETFANEVYEALCVDRTHESLMTQHSVDSDGPDHREVVTRFQRLRVDDALTSNGASVSQGHRDVASRLVDEDQPTGIDIGHRGYVRRAVLPDVRAILFRRTKPFFFQVKPAFSKERCIAERLSGVPCRRSHSLQSSTTVRSGFSATNALRVPYSDSAIRGGKPPPCGPGSTSRVSLSSRSHRETLASPTPNSSAICGYVPFPARYAATTRRRRSFEIGAAISSLRSCSPDQRKRAPV
jgi:hypothetical protein